MRDSKCTVFTNVKVITPDRVIENAAVVVENGRIQDVLLDHESRHALDGVKIDGQGCYLAPGFIDLHCHGGGGHDFM
ncbi:MAG TPA: N-acetylglucosamine-6-phosphate deacetylase, partial [Ruminococcaceae bacterium]|nr:N-acetylglucosamine-6-phosphate deacetylase [Oscillospiraceae bacterium]